MSLNTSYVAQMSCANFRWVRATPCWWEHSSISQAQNCYKDQIGDLIPTFVHLCSPWIIIRWCSAMFSYNHNHLAHWFACLLVCFDLITFLTLFFFLPHKYSIQRGLGTLLESLLFCNMIFSFHILLNLPLIQFNVMHLSKVPCAPGSLFSATLTLRKLQIYNCLQNVSS